MSADDLIEGLLHSGLDARSRSQANTVPEEKSPVADHTRAPIIYLTPHDPRHGKRPAEGAKSASDAGALEIIDPDPVEVLSSILREKMEHLDPTETGDLAWSELRERDRQFYRLCVLEIIRSREAIDAIRRQRADNGCIEQFTSAPN